MKEINFVRQETSMDKNEMIGCCKKPGIGFGKNEIQKSLLHKAASKSPCKYRIAAMAFDKKGDVLGVSRNRFRANGAFMGNQNRRGTGLHAEAYLMRRYGKNVKTILIMRIGRSGSILPIDPCLACARTAEKLGIKIITVCGREEQESIF